MKKRELEAARRFSTGLDTNSLRTRLATELKPVKDAYDVAHQGVEQIKGLMQNVQHEENPTKAIRELAAALKDVSQVLKSMRDEGRDSVRFAAEAAREGGVGEGTPDGGSGSTSE